MKMTPTHVDQTINAFKLYFGSLSGLVELNALVVADTQIDGETIKHTFLQEWQLLCHEFNDLPLIVTSGYELNQVMISALVTPFTEWSPELLRLVALSLPKLANVLAHNIPEAADGEEIDPFYLGITVEFAQQNYTQEFYEQLKALYALAYRCFQYSQDEHHQMTVQHMPAPTDIGLFHPNKWPVPVVAPQLTSFKAHIAVDPLHGRSEATDCSGKAEAEEGVQGDYDGELPAEAERVDAEVEDRVFPFRGVPDALFAYLENSTAAQMQRYIKGALQAANTVAACLEISGILERFVETDLDRSREFADQAFEALLVGVREVRRH